MPNIPPVLITTGDFPPVKPDAVDRMVDAAGERRGARLKATEVELRALSNPDLVYQKFIELSRLTAKDIADGALQLAFGITKPIGYIAERFVERRVAGESSREGRFAGFARECNGRDDSDALSEPLENLVTDHLAEMIDRGYGALVLDAIRKQAPFLMPAHEDLRIKGETCKSTVYRFDFPAILLALAEKLPNQVGAYLLELTGRDSQWFKFNSIADPNCYEWRDRTMMGVLAEMAATGNGNHVLQLLNQPGSLVYEYASRQPFYDLDPKTLGEFFILDEKAFYNETSAKAGRLLHGIAIAANNMPAANSAQRTEKAVKFRRAVKDGLIERMLKARGITDLAGRRAFIKSIQVYTRNDELHGFALGGTAGRPEDQPPKDDRGLLGTTNLLAA